jgi:hypothetical protein
VFPALRKRHFFLLCRQWGLRSDVWTRRVSRRAARAEARVAAAEAAAEAAGSNDGVVALLERPLTPSPALAALCACSELTRPVAAYAEAIYMRGVVAASAAEPFAPLTTMDLPLMAVLSAHLRALRLTLLDDAAALRCACSALRGATGGDADVPAWRLGARAPPHAERALQQLLMLAHSLAASIADAEHGGSDGLVAALGRPLSAPERAHMNDLAASADALQPFLSAAASTLARMRMGAGGAYLDAGAAVVEQIVAVLDATVAGNTCCIAHFAAHPGVRPPVWRSTFIGHAVSAGAMPAPPQAAAQAAPWGVVACGGV